MFLVLQSIPCKKKPRGFWKKARIAGKRNLHLEEQSSTAKGRRRRRRRRRREGARDYSSADIEGDPAESMYTALVIDGVDTSIDGVDTGSLFLEFFHEDRVQCVDTALGVDTVPGSVDTRSSFQKTLFGQLGQCVDTLSGSVDTLRLKFHLMIFLDTWPLGDQGNLPRQEEREKGICIQRSRAVPPREEEGEEEGEEDKELVIAAVLIQKEIQPNLKEVRVIVLQFVLHLC
ncbi:hypothetical protein Taro_002463 [Colocasia esculenta]|uniref:Uncharacterized protein n=1 Tax=Colocasia esculenta TaxID=4460 RepID=A0A843TIQ6_COLES|nr:hypothetical protein [Colocasia esculenta]